MAKQNKPNDQDQENAVVQEEVYDIDEVADDSAFDDDWDEEADLDDGWGAKSTPAKEQAEPVVPTYEVLDRSYIEDAEDDFEDDFEDEAKEAEKAEDAAQEVYDVPEAPETYDVPEAHTQEVYEVPEAPAAQQSEEVYDVPEAPVAAQAAIPDEDVDVDVDVPVAQQADVEGEEQEDIVLGEEPVKSEEDLAREEQELEDYRSLMGDSNAEMADVSAYRNFRRKTKTEPVSSKPKKSEFDLFANRYKIKTMNATVAATDPIIYFYNACLRRNGSIMMFNVYQVLQDRFLGKMVPQLYTAVAEGSNKIDELNEANLLAQLSICAEFPDYEFIISMSPHGFTKPALLERLLNALPEEGVPNLVFAYDCASLQSIADAAKKGLSTVRARGIKVLLDNTERVTMDVLSEMEYDYIRIDARYYEMGNPRAEAYLRLLLSFAQEQGIGTIATFCDTEDMADYMLFLGVDAVQGNSISRPMRTVPNSVKAITLLPSMLAIDEESKEKY